jgi:hypothetical protein
MSTSETVAVVAEPEAKTLTNTIATETRDPRPS